MLKQIIETESIGRTVDEAVEQGLAVLGCSRAEVALNIVQPGSPGLFGFWFKRSAVVKLIVEDRAYIARRIVAQLLQQMGVDAQVVVHPSRVAVDLFIQSDDANLIIGRHGQTLDALTTLTTLLTNSIDSGRSLIRIDINGYRARREQSLLMFAQRAAGRVRRTGKSVSLDIQSTFEQNIVTDYFRTVPGLVCHSVTTAEGLKVDVRSALKGSVYG